jgi:uncharacterized membrane protein
MATDQQRRAALGLLAELVPAGVLSRAHNLAQQIEQDEYVRSYLARNAVWIVAFGLIAILVSTAGTGFLLSYIFRELGPIASWIKIFIACFGIAIWLAGILMPLYVLLLRLQRDALRARELAKDR